MAEVKWIKLTVNMFDDEKIQLIQSMPEGDAILLIWIRLILLAGKCNCGGYVYFSDEIPYTEEMLATIFHKPLNVIKLALKTFEQFHMIEIDSKGIYLVNFDKYQNVARLDEIREYNRLAKQRERERKRKLLTDDVNDKSMTSQKCQETDIDIDKDIDIDISSSSNIVSFYVNNINPMAPVLEIEQITSWLDEFSEDVILLAMQKAIDNKVRTKAYIEGILRRWMQAEAKTIEAISEFERQFQERKEYSRGQATRNSATATGTDKVNARQAFDRSKFTFNG